MGKMDHMQNIQVKIKLDATWLNNNLNFVKFDTNWFIVPKNDSLYEYWDYLKEYLSDISSEFDGSGILDIKKTKYYKSKSEPDSTFTGMFTNVYINAEFPDEDSALYFKLKYL